MGKVVKNLRAHHDVDALVAERKLEPVTADREIHRGLARPRELFGRIEPKGNELDSVLVGDLAGEPRDVAKPGADIQQCRAARQLLQHIPELTNRRAASAEKRVGPRDVGERAFDDLRVDVRRVEELTLARARRRQKRAHHLALELRVSTTVIQERPRVFGVRCFHLPNDYSVIAAIVERSATTLDRSDDIVQHRNSCLRSAIPDALEPVDVHDGEPSRELLLIGGEDVDYEAGACSQRFVCRGCLLDADENEWRYETHRTERTHRHPVVSARCVEGGNDRYTRRKSTEHISEFVFRDAQLRIAGERNKSKRNRGVRTASGGTKSPATPIRRSAISFRVESARAA